MESKRYYTLNNFYRNKFNSKVFKVSLDAGFSCPNKDGTKSFGGCIFCTRTPYIGDKSDDLITQFNKIKNMLHKKWKEAKYIVYFEAGSNTYSGVETLKRTFEPFLKIENVVGINIGTRCDCLDKSILSYLEELSKKTFLTVELGLQSMHDKTLKFINRGHTLKEFDDAVKNLKMRGINVVVHIINGLPFETKEMMLETVKHINKLRVDGIKFHMLYLEDDSTLTKYYKKNPFGILSKDEYISIVCEQLRYLDKNIVIHRITSDPDRKKLLTPAWLVKKFVVLNDIDKYMLKNDIYQGDLTSNARVADNTFI